MLNTGEVYAITAVVACMLTGLVYGRMSAPLHRKAIETSFMMMLRFFMLFNVMDALWGICYSGIINSPPIFTLVGYGYHTMCALSGFAWLYYVLEFTRNRRSIHKFAMAMGCLLLFAELAIILSNPYHHLVFNVDENNEYTIDTLRSVLYGLQFSYYILAMVGSAIMSRFEDNDEGRARQRTSFIYSLGPAAFCVAQCIFYDAAMYSMGFAYVALLICLYRQSSRIAQLRQDEFNSATHEQLSIIRSLAGNFTGIYYVDTETGHYDRFFKGESPTGLECAHNVQDDFFQKTVEWGHANVASADLEDFLLAIDKENVVRTLEEQNEKTMLVRLKRGDKLVYHRVKATRSVGEKAENRIVVALYDVDREHRQTMQQQAELVAALDEMHNLEYAAHRDFMTGLFNRRAFEDHVQNLFGMPDGGDFVLVMMNLNKLRDSNMNLGHEAGDEMIKGAATSMKQCLGGHGRVYRLEGGSFSAILHADSDTLKTQLARLDQVLSEWKGTMVSSLSIATGYATAQEKPGASVEELEKLADQRMQEDRDAYYARLGIDRRAQQEAFETLRDSYTKVLKVDLKKDTFSIVKTENREQDSGVGFSNTFSEWVYGFAKAGLVHKNDLEEYLQKTRLKYMRRFFAAGKGNLSFWYKRKADDDFRETMMEIIPAGNFAPDNQIVFLYVRKVSGDDHYLRLQDIRDNMELSMQMQWGKNMLEFPTDLVRKENGGVYVKPYMRDGHALKFDALLTDSVQCRLFAQDRRLGWRVMWHDVELRSVEGPQGVLYHVTTREFNQYSRPGERRLYSRSTSNVAAMVSDMHSFTAEAVLHDISSVGISFCTAKPVDFVGDVLSISFEDTIDDEKFSINTVGKLVRHNIEHDRVVYGCLLHDPSQEYQLYAFMHKLRASRA